MVNDVVIVDIGLRGGRDYRVLVVYLSRLIVVLSRYIEVST